ncbi:MAG: cytochrome c [Longimicrobiales bacterium]|nr:cytochrome c [Longimicrobiales bacterium]
MTERLPGLAALTVIAALALAPGTTNAQDSTVTTLDSIYTAAQAERGREVYIRVCSQCHTLDWYQGEIIRAWEGGPLYNLFEVISTRMPEDNPGSLSRREYVAVLAYILSINGLPAGSTPLSTGRSRLAAILFKFAQQETP